MYEPYDDRPRCTACHSRLELLGVLGRVWHYMCSACGLRHLEVVIPEGVTR